MDALFVHIVVSRLIFTYRTGIDVLFQTMFEGSYNLGLYASFETIEFCRVFLISVYFPDCN